MNWTTPDRLLPPPGRTVYLLLEDGRTVLGFCSGGTPRRWLEQLPPGGAASHVYAKDVLGWRY